MLDHFRSDLFDELILRGIKTLNNLEDKKDQFGNIYPYLTNCFGKNIKLGVGEANDKVKKYYKFIKKSNKIDQKKRKLDYAFTRYSVLKRLRQKLNRWLYEDLINTYELLKIKFKPYLPASYLETDVATEEKPYVAPAFKIVKPITVEEVKNEIKKKKDDIKSVEEVASPENNVIEQVQPYQLIDVNFREISSCSLDIPPGQIEIELDKLFNPGKNENEEEKA